MTHDFNALLDALDRNPESTSDAIRQAMIDAGFEVQEFDHALRMVRSMGFTQAEWERAVRSPRFPFDLEPPRRPATPMWRQIAVQTLLDWRDAAREIGLAGILWALGAGTWFAVVGLAYLAGR